MENVTLQNTPGLFNAEFRGCTVLTGCTRKKAGIWAYSVLVSSVHDVKQQSVMRANRRRRLNIFIDVVQPIMGMGASNPRLTYKVNNYFLIITDRGENQWEILKTI